MRAAAAWVGRYLSEPADYQGQDGLENVVIGDSWQFLPQLPDVRVLSTVDPPVRAHPCRPVFFLQAGFQRVERGFAAGPGQGEIGDGPVDAGRRASLKTRVEDCPDERVGNPHLCRSLRGAARGQRSRRRVVAKGAADTSHYVCDGVHPAGMGGQAGDRILDQLIHYGKDQVVFAGEVPVDGGRIRAESTAQLRHAESIQALVVKQLEALLDDQFWRQAPSPQTAPPAARRSSLRGCTSHRFSSPGRWLAPTRLVASITFVSDFVIAIDITIGPWSNL